MGNQSKIFDHVLLALVACGLLTGTALWFSQAHPLARMAWGATTLLALVPLTFSLGRQILRREFGVDLIALFAMVTSLLFGEYLAGAVVALMLTGGQALEAFADGRAKRELTALLQRAPQQVHRYDNGHLTTPPLDAVRIGDTLLVKPGEVVPVDGVVMSEACSLDESALTGESRLVERAKGDQVLSGVVNAGSAGFDLRAIATADHSTYAGIVRLVTAAQAAKAPFARLADRYAIFLVPLTLAVAAMAWIFSGDPVRALAVLVVATPCPLILATPVALISGISRAAKRGIIIKGGGPLEALARANILLLDKTGTLTTGQSTLHDVASFTNVDPLEVLRLAASLDQVSTHVLAAAIVKAARSKNLSLSFPNDVAEFSGTGIRGVVDGKRIAVGKSDWVSAGQALSARVREVRKRAALEGLSNVFVSIDDTLVGAIVLNDPIRTETPRTIRALRKQGIHRVVMVTGDHPDVANIVGAAIGADSVLAERSPSEKVEAVKEETARGFTLMVGDGINDAPALAAAGVGVAMGARGATASSEAADVVLMVDRFDRLIDAMQIAKRSYAIARQSIWAGMGLSAVGMGVAAFGYLPPVMGAFFQEAIDIAVILNALRALTPPRTKTFVLKPDLLDATEKLRHDHRDLLPQVLTLRQTADRLDTLPPDQAKTQLEAVRHFLVDVLLPHELEEDKNVYPLIAKMMGGKDPTAIMSRAHLEISHLTRLYSQMVDNLEPTGPKPEDFRDLRRTLYGLHALLVLHFAQEDEHYLALIDEKTRAKRSFSI